MVPAQISMPLIACLAMTLPEQEIKEVLSSLSQSKVGHACQDSARLFELVFGELHKLAADRLRRERPDHTLQPTALVNEVYLRLVAAMTRSSGTTRVISLRQPRGPCGRFSSIMRAASWPVNALAADNGPILI